VTAQDVKWSLDRAVTVGGVPTFQMAAGSMQKQEQFVVVDDHTFRIDFLRKDRLTLPDLAVPTIAIINSALAKQHATDKDPWAMEWLKNNEAGSGAYQIEKWTPGQELIYRRFDDWKSGSLPKIQRVIWRMVPSPSNRRALIERGDADVSFDLPPKDVSELAEEKKLKVVGTPIDNCIVYIDMNGKTPHSTNSKCARRSPMRSHTRRSWMRPCSAAAYQCLAGQLKFPHPSGPSRALMLPT
jgi:peptide/nickel transport system substrate-binding protein